MQKTPTKQGNHYGRPFYFFRNTKEQVVENNTRKASTATVKYMFDILFLSYIQIFLMFQ